MNIEKKQARPHALVTGGAGFIGANLAHRLLQEGWSVRILDDLSRPGVEANLRELELIHGSQLEVEIGDVCDSRVVRRALSGVTDVVHLAGQVSVVASLDSPEIDWRANVGGTVNLLNEILRLGSPPLVLVASTNKVYGSLQQIPLVQSATRYQPSDQAIRYRGIAESAPLIPDTPYSHSKAIAERFALQHTKSGRIPVIVFRMSCIYGPRQMGHEGQGWVSHFMCQAQKGKQVTLFGDGKQVRDLLFIDDLVDACLVALSKVDTLAGTSFNIGGGPMNAYSIYEIASRIGDCFPERCSPAFGEWRSSDQRWYVSNFELFHARTGWSPKVSVDAGLQLMRAWSHRVWSVPGSDTSVAGSA